MALLLVAWSLPGTAAAEKILASGPDWEVYSDGRAGAFASWAYGQGLPTPTYANDINGMPVPIHNIQGGGFSSSREQPPLDAPGLTFPPGQAPPAAGTINMMRARSGFITNIFGFGLRSALTPSTNVTVYIQFWAFVESEGRQKNRPNYPDARQGYAALHGPWGSLLAGRTRALFSRGATDIDVLYAHRWGVGWPGSIDSNGPTQGQIGFGVLGSGFAAGIIYTTPVLGGLQLAVGGFDPIQLQGNGGWNRTKYLRPESELTFERRFGATGKIVLFANGAYQKVYKEGNCDPSVNPCEATAAGFGYGGRFELGPFHLGVAGHYGTGLGLNYALEVSDAAQDPEGTLRKFDGYYGQVQVVLGRFDLFTGAGIARVFLTGYDNTHKVQDPRDPTNPSARVFPFSVIKYQLGENAGVVFNYNASLHFDVDFFLANARWYFGESQRVLVSSAGMTYAW